MHNHHEPFWCSCLTLLLVCVSCRRGSSRLSSPSRSGCRCSRLPNRHRWQRRLPAPPSRPALLRTKTKRTICDSLDAVITCLNPVAAHEAHSTVIKRDTRRVEWTVDIVTKGDFRIVACSENNLDWDVTGTLLTFLIKLMLPLFFPTVASVYYVLIFCCE